MDRHGIPSTSVLRMHLHHDPQSASEVPSEIEPVDKREIKPTQKKPGPQKSEQTVRFEKHAGNYWREKHPTRLKESELNELLKNLGADLDKEDFSLEDAFEREGETKLKLWQFIKAYNSTQRVKVIHNFPTLMNVITQKKMPRS